MTTATMGNIFKSTTIVRIRAETAGRLPNGGISCRAQRGIAIVPVECVVILSEAKDPHPPDRGLSVGTTCHLGLASRTEGSFYMSGMSSMLGIALDRDASSHHEPK